MLTLSVRVLRHTALVFLSVGPVRFVVNPIRVRICFSKDVPLSVPSVADRHFYSEAVPPDLLRADIFYSKAAPPNQLRVDIFYSKAAPPNLLCGSAPHYTFKL